MPKTSDWPLASELSHDEWRDRVHAYAATSDRDVEPVFVGREDLFDVVDKSLHNARHDRTGSLTIIIGGAPGAGKSAFVAECLRRYGSEGSPAVPVQMAVRRIGSGEFVYLLGKALDKTPVERVSESRSSRKGGTAGIAGTGGRYERVSTTETVTPSDLERAERDGPVPWNVIEELYAEKLSSRPIILFVDEAQNFCRTGERNHDGIPEELHQGPTGGQDVAVIPVYTGLADTRQVLRDEAGVTRPDERNVLPLGALSRSESEEYVKAVVGDYLGAVGARGQLSKLSRWTLDHCDDWPQHLRSMNAAVAECMLEANSRDLRDLDATALQQRAKSRRNQYYEARNAGASNGLFPDVAKAVIERSTERGGAEQRSLSMLAHARLQEEPADSGEDIPSGSRYIADMIHAGMLQKDAETGLFVCPIPSLHTWLERRDCRISKPRCIGREGLSH